MLYKSVRQATARYPFWYWLQKSVLHILALLWRFIGWFWSAIVLGLLLSGIVQRELDAYLSRGQFDPINLLYLPFLLWAQSHIAIAFLVLFILLALSIAAFLAHRYRQREAALAPLKSAHTLQRVELLDPHNFKLIYYVQSAYIPRDADGQARQILRDLAASKHTLNHSHLGICIVGRPAQGKTRLAWEAIQAELADWTLFRWIHEQVAPSDFSLYQGQKVLLWLDDLHEYANPSASSLLNDLPRRFLEANCHLIIVATCRDGANYTQTQKYLESLLERLTIIRLHNIDPQMASTLATQLTTERPDHAIHTDEFDGTPGSLLLGLGRMHGRYLHLASPAQMLLKTMKLLYSAQIFVYPQSRVVAVAHDIFSFSPASWRESIEALQSEGFVTIQVSPQGERSLVIVADSYLAEKVVQDYPLPPALLADDWLALKSSLEQARDATGLLSLGNTYHEHSALHPGPPSEYAVRCYRAALQIYTREQTPAQWAMAHNNLGIALRHLAHLYEGGARLHHLDTSIKALRAALQIYTREQTPAQWAMAHNNLGVTLRDLAASQDGVERLQPLTASISAYQRALEVYSREQFPLDRALTQNNLGIALNDLATNQQGEERLRNLHLSISVYRAALEVYSREQSPSRWAMVQGNLGAALRDLAVDESEVERVRYLYEAINACQSALEVYNREQTPTEWALVQNNLGTALRDLAPCLPEADRQNRLAEAIQAYRAALQVYTREQSPLEWAMTQNNLGTVLSNFGAGEHGPLRQQHLNAALAAYDATLQVRTREHFPVQWANLQRQIALAHFLLKDALHEQSAICSQLQQASRAILLALDSFDHDNYPANHAQMLTLSHAITQAISTYACAPVNPSAASVLSQNTLSPDGPAISG